MTFKSDSQIVGFSGPVNDRVGRDHKLKISMMESLSGV
jgi:hypothetical protein